MLHSEPRLSPFSDCFGRVRGGVVKGGGKMENENLNSKELKEVPDFSTELKKLKKIFKNIPKDKKNLVQKLIESAAFMSVELTKLENYISVNGVSETYQNGENQYGTKTSTEASVYNTMIKNYTSIIKQLCELLPEGLPTTKEGNALMNFVTKPKGK